MNFSKKQTKIGQKYNDFGPKKRPKNFGQNELKKGHILRQKNCQNDKTLNTTNFRAFSLIFPASGG